MQQRATGWIQTWATLSGPVHPSELNKHPDKPAFNRKKPSTLDTSGRQDSDRIQ